MLQVPVSYKRKNILVVEDDADQRHMLKVALEGAGHSVHTAFSGEHAVFLAEVMSVDLAILDVMLGAGIDGLETLCRITLNPATSSIPVMIVSAYLDQERIELLLQAGAELYMTKPYDIFVLIKTVEQLLAAREERLNEERLHRGQWRDEDANAAERGKPDG